MAPPTIRDEDTILEISVIFNLHPNWKFSEVCRAAVKAAPAVKHSEDSYRRRLQRKFNSRREYWLNCGHEELLRRREEQRRIFYEDLGEKIENIAKVAGPMVEKMQWTCGIFEKIMLPRIAGFSGIMNPDLAASVSSIAKSPLMQAISNLSLNTRVPGYFIEQRNLGASWPQEDRLLRFIDK